MHLSWYLAVLSTAFAAPLLQVERDALVVQGQYIVKLKHDEATISTSTVQTLKQSLSTRPKYDYSFSGFHGFAGTLSKAELARLQASDQVQRLPETVKFCLLNTCRLSTYNQICGCMRMTWCTRIQ